MTNISAQISKPTQISQRLTPLEAADPTIVNAASPLPEPSRNPNPTPPALRLFGLTHLYLNSPSICISRPMFSSTARTCFMTSGGAPVVIVVWSTAPWCTAGTPRPAGAGVLRTRSMISAMPEPVDR